MPVQSMTGESPVERQVWLYRKLYGLPCQVSGTRITLSTNDVSAINAPSGMAARIDDELFWSKKVTPILDQGTGSDGLILLAAPSPLDTSCRTTALRAQCEFLPPGVQIALPCPLAPTGPEPHWFRYPQCEMLQPLTEVLRAIRIVLRDIPRTYPA